MILSIVFIAYLSLLNSFPYSVESPLPLSKRRHVESEEFTNDFPERSLVSEEDGEVPSGSVAQYDRRGEARNHPIGSGLLLGEPVGTESVNLSSDPKLPV